MDENLIFDKFYLQVDYLHKIHVSQFGCEKGIPILFLHGGPGVGILKNDTRFFDPKAFRVILVDQRGCGKSTPLGCIENNTIDYLVEDIEKIRIYLKITKWHIFGGSWGSTLALYYAINYPFHCISLILRGICLFEEYDINWWLNGVSMIYPDAYSQFINGIDLNKYNLLDFYYKQLCSQQLITKWNYQWFLYEMVICKVNPNERIKTFLKMKDEEDIIYSSSRIMSHYFKYCRPQILDNCQVIENIPIFAVHGRFDIVCPIINAFNLKKKLPHMELNIAEMSGHSSDELEIDNALTDAVKRIKNINI